MKLDKMSYIIYVDIKSLIKKINGYGNSPENSSTTKMSENIPCGYSMLTIWAFNQIENKHILYCRKDCMKKFDESLREHTKHIIGFEKKKKKLPLTKAKLKSHQDPNYVICEKGTLKKLSKV